MRTFFIFLFSPFLCMAQYKGVSYELRNEIGTFKLTSLTFSHRIDNEEGITYVTDKTGKDTLYSMDQFLNGFVGLSNDGKTIVHVQSEKNSLPLNKSILTFYRNGEKFDAAELGKLIKYELDDAVKKERLPRSGWLRNDSLLHTMASNSFYITDDKVFISTDGPLLHAFDVNEMFHVYTGNGANHFMQNYYSIPNMPFRSEFNSSEYFPKEFPKTENGEEFNTVLEKILGNEISIPEEAKWRVEIEFLLNSDGTFSSRKTTVYSINSNKTDAEKSQVLKDELGKLKFETSLLPPKHPSWLFSNNFWLK
ncbi:MAG: hypothetical protein K9J17_03840 [Flavobacteriales bacterium]|nr:hypothetical protein [Flavobacteriales bacterium]